MRIRKITWLALSLMLINSYAPLVYAAEGDSSGIPSAVMGDVGGETKSAETKAGETKAGETKAGETRPGETRPGETRPAEPTSSKPAEETKPAGTTLGGEEVPMVAPVLKPGHVIKEGPKVTPAEGPKNTALVPAKTAAPIARTTASPTATGGYKLFGRIEEIANGPGANFPIVLKAMTPKLDTAPKLQGQANAANTPGGLTGAVVRSFPTDYRGVWGGTLTVAQMVFDPICWQIDPDEANRTRMLIRNGSQGTVNFTFSNDAQGNIDVQPAQITFMVPFKDTNSSDELRNMMSSGQGSQQIPGMGALGQLGMGNNPAMAGMMQQMMGSMMVPIMVTFGSYDTNAYVKGVSGNDFRAQLLKNNIRQLAPGVLEQQMVASEVSRVKRTGRIVQTYNETVMRFTKQSANQLYVQCASVTYGIDKRFQKKMVMYGTVSRGNVQQGPTDPFQGLMGGMGGMGGLQQMFGGGQPSNYGGSQNPYGNLQNNPLLNPNSNPFQSIFGGQ